MSEEYRPRRRVFYRPFLTIMALLAVLLFALEEFWYTLGAFALVGIWTGEGSFLFFRNIRLKIDDDGFVFTRHETTAESWQNVKKVRVTLAGLHIEIPNKGLTVPFMPMADQKKVMRAYCKAKNFTPAPSTWFDRII